MFVESLPADAIHPSKNHHHHLLLLHLILTDGSHPPHTTNRLTQNNPLDATREQDLHLFHPSPFPEKKKQSTLRKKGGRKKSHFRGRLREKIFIPKLFYSPERNGANTSPFCLCLRLLHFLLFLSSPPCPVGLLGGRKKSRPFPLLSLFSPLLRRRSKRQRARYGIRRNTLQQFFFQ